MQVENLRTAIVAMDRELSALPRGPGASSLAGVTDAWAGVVKAIDLEPEAPQRECPACHHLGMLKASRCGYCWIVLPPLT
jgi:hypothetical protein